jgi:transposase
MHYLIKDTDFKKILNFLTQIKGIHQRNVKKLRKFFEAVYYVCRSGCQWRLLPYSYGNWRSVHKRFKGWSERNIWKQIFELSHRDADLEWVMIDSTIVRAHASAAGYVKYTQPHEALGRSKGGFSTKIHVLVDALGNPLKFILTPGQRNDITQAKNLIENIDNAYVLADKGYDADAFIDLLSYKNCSPIIPPKSNRKKPREYDTFLYKDRSLVEIFFGKIKHFRRIFSRFDKSARSYLSLLHFVGTLIWFR